LQINEDSGEAVKHIVEAEGSVVVPTKIWYGGLDRSGTAVLDSRAVMHDPYVVTVAIASFPLDDPAQLGIEFARLRQRFGIAGRKEFHAHRLSEKILLAVLEVAQSFGLVIGAVIIDKAQTVAGWEEGRPYPTQHQLREDATGTILNLLFRRYQLGKLWVDEDVRGQAAKEEKTVIQRIHRSIWTDRKLHCQHKPSHDSELIQIADIAAYCLSLYVRRSIRMEPLRIMVDSFWTDPRHIILGPTPWTPADLGDDSVKE
jgi:hypothetical protein